MYLASTACALSVEAAAEVAPPPLEPVSVAVLLPPEAAGVAVVSSSPYLEVMEAIALLSVGSAKTAEET